MPKTLLILLFLISANILPQSFFDDSNKNAVIVNDVVATIGNLKITAGEFFYSYEFGPAFPKRGKNSKNIYLQYMINEKLLALEGYANNLLKKDDVKNLFGDIQADLATEEMFKDEILSKVSISSEELESGIELKQNVLYLKWLYFENEQTMNHYVRQMDIGISFDSLFSLQLNDSVFANDRELNATEFDLIKKNFVLAKIIADLKPGEISYPIKVEEGWYIVKYANKWKNMLTGETEYEKIKSEVREALTETKIDSMSGLYVNKLMLEENPVIQREVADVLKYYIAEHIIPGETNEQWETRNKLDSILTKLGFNKNDNYKSLAIAKGKNTDFTLEEFLNWFWNRDQYFKILKDNYLNYSLAMEKIIWQMVRDKILTGKAKEKGYFENSWVKFQSGWWKDKIVYSAERNELGNMVMINYEEKGIPSNFKKPKDDYLTSELTKITLHKLVALKKKYKVVINQNILDKIKVSSENEPKSIEVYYVKKGSLIPRNPFPTINAEWAGWE